MTVFVCGLIVFHVYTQAGQYLGVSEGQDELEAIVRYQSMCTPDRFQSDLLAFPYFLGHRIET